MTGSGKTGLGIDLLEDALLQGIPCLVIDPKGDMGNLLLTFPELRPSDFRPWIEEAAAAREGITPDELAAQTAQTWRDGLARSGITPERIARLRAGGRLHHLHARLERRRAAQPHRLAQGSRTRPTTSRRCATRSRASPPACWASSASTPIRSRAPSTSSSPTSSSAAGRPGRTSTWRHCWGRSRTRRCASSACSTSMRSTRPRTAPPWR